MEGFGIVFLPHPILSADLQTEHSFLVQTDTATDIKRNLGNRSNIAGMKTGIENN